MFWIFMFCFDAGDSFLTPHHLLYLPNILYSYSYTTALEIRICVRNVAHWQFITVTLYRN